MENYAEEERAYAPQTVSVVDDEPSVRESLRWVLKSVKLEAEVYASGVELLENLRRSRAGCILLDVRMPGMSGIEVQAELVRRGVGTPVIFITAHADVHIAVRAMKTGAIDFIQKPFNVDLLLDRILHALRIE